MLIALLARNGTIGLTTRTHAQMDAPQNPQFEKTYYIEETKDGMFNVFSRLSQDCSGVKPIINYIGGYDTRAGAEALLLWIKEKGHSL